MGVGMDHVVFSLDLAAIERRVAEAEKRIEWHCARIKALQGRGLDARADKTILQECRNVLALHLRIHARLVEQLTRAGVYGPS